MYPTDGIIIEVDNGKEREQFGYTRKYFKGAIALKPKPLIVTSKVINIDYTINSNGLLIPNVEIEPVNLKGKVIRNINCYNINNLLNLEIAVGGLVNIILSGEVIPKIVSANSDGLAVVAPYVCPFCNSKLGEKQSNVFCNNDKCDGIRIAKLKNDLRKYSKGISSKVVEKLL